MEKNIADLRIVATNGHHQHRRGMATVESETAIETGGEGIKSDHQRTSASSQNYRGSSLTAISNISGLYIAILTSPLKRSASSARIFASRFLLPLKIV
ncbi:hypothetical protein NL676_014631 [Syzygium grande]|nr:hypothetical protein NL676_014631 [Syzygium grande]